MLLQFVLLFVNVCSILGTIGASIKSQKVEIKEEKKYKPPIKEVEKEPVKEIKKKKDTTQEP